MSELTNIQVDAVLPFNTDLDEAIQSVEDEVTKAYWRGYRAGRDDVLDSFERVRNKDMPVFQTWDELEHYIRTKGNLT